jgi:hypothetical protein
MLRLSTMTEPLETIEREVWATAEEFRRGLSLAFPGRLGVRDGLLCAADDGAAMEIALEVLAPKTIALLNLPRMKVSLRMTAGTPEQRKAMLARMDLAMHRGGG